MFFYNGHRRCALGDRGEIRRTRSAARLACMLHFLSAHSGKTIRARIPASSTGPIR